MNKSRFYVFIAAAAAIMSLCGIFFYPPIQPVSKSVWADTYSPSPQFSLNEARKLIDLCSASYEPALLEKKLLEDDYLDFEYFERNQQGHTGSGIAAGVGHTKDKIILVFRGTNKGEWYSNFSIGESTEHSGFSAAADYSLEMFEEYLTRHNLKKENFSLCITGHSRGGAVANICAKRLIEGGGFSSIIAYTFASPNTTTAENAHSEKFRSIYNIINTEDFICYIPLEKWGYQRYGTDLELPTAGEKENREIYEKMQSEFLLKTGYNHTGYTGGHSDVESFLSAAGNLAPTISDYYRKEISVHPNRITLYEYMENAATLLSGEKSLSKGMILLSGGISPKFHPLTKFMLQGIRIEDISEESSISHSAIGCGHTYETYGAWLKVLDEDYFTKNPSDE